jgi:hypothetical protein
MNYRVTCRPPCQHSGARRSGQTPWRPDFAGGYSGGKSWAISMSSIYVIVCHSCGSYRTEVISTTRRKTRFRCAACGDKFDVYDTAKYVKDHLPDLSRCSECDWKVAVELIQKDYCRGPDPDGEIADLHKCGVCGHEFIVFVRQSPGVIY